MKRKTEKAIWLRVAQEFFFCSGMNLIIAIFFAALIFCFFFIKKKEESKFETNEVGRVLFSYRSEFIPRLPADNSSHNTEVMIPE